MKKKKGFRKQLPNIIFSLIFLVGLCIFLQRRGHKHYWQVGKGKYGETTVYFVADDGEIEYAESDPDWRREAEEQLDMVYSERDFCWYDKDDERADPYYDQSYGRDDILSDYYNDLL